MNSPAPRRTASSGRSARLWHDISPVISPRTAVFPGDQPFRREVALDFASGANLLLSAVHTTVHIGAHADAPNHYHPDGAPIDVRPLDRYFGACQVLRVGLPRGERIRVEHLRAEVQAPRILFRTDSFPDPDRWNGDFNALSPALIEYLAAQGVVLAGIDTPSVDLADDKVLETHEAIYRSDLAILEGLVLNEVADGLYTLIALPLRIEGADAAPVRAALIADGGAAGGDAF